MKIKEFTYTKDSGDVSKRSLVVLVEPSVNVAGIDVTDMEPDEFALFSIQLKQLKDLHNEELKKLYASFDLKHNYRQFKPANMTEVVSEDL